MFHFFSEMKLVGDGYAGGFSCGMTMHNSQTMEDFQMVEDTPSVTVRVNSRGVRLIERRVQDGEAVRIQVSVENGSDAPITLEMLTSFGLKGVSADRIHRLQSCWSAEGKLRTETMEDLHMEVSWNRCAQRVEKFGNVGSMPVRKYFPFLALEDSVKHRVVGVQLYCASSWQMELLCKEDESFTLIGGLADGDFGQWRKRLEPGESFEAPEAVVAEGETLYDVCDRLVKAQHPDISEADDRMGILFNEYCTTWGNPSYDNLKKIADKLEGKGVQFLVIDSGWYGLSDRWWDCIGDWDVNEKRFPGGMKPIADYIRSKGMIPGLWFEMESVANGSVHYHDQELLVRKDGVILNVGGRHFWDMENPKVVDYLSEKVIGQLKTSGFGYLKVDYNDTMGMGCDGAESPGEGLRRKVEGSKEFFRKIKRDIPDIVIENCSSGGHRLEPSMMALASQASFSDAHEIPSIPLIAANMHRVVPPKQSQIWAVLRAKDSGKRIQYSIAATFLGRMCLSGEIYDLSEKQWQQVERGMDFYRLAAPIIQQGKTILIEAEPTGYNRPRGQQLVLRELDDRGLAVMHRFEHSRDVSDSLPPDVEILMTYGDGDSDFSAKAWLYRKKIDAQASAL